MHSRATPGPAVRTGRGVHTSGQIIRRRGLKVEGVYPMAFESEGRGAWCGRRALRHLPRFRTFDSYNDGESA